jgi:hypothetical protein
MSRAYSGAPVDQKVTTIFCTPVTRDPRCPDCGRQGRYRDAVTRPLTDPPVAGYPLVLRVAVPRYRVSPAIVDGWCSVKIWASWRPRGRRRPAMCSVCVAAVDEPVLPQGHRPIGALRHLLRPTILTPTTGHCCKRTLNPPGVLSQRITCRGWRGRAPSRRRSWRSRPRRTTTATAIIITAKSEEPAKAPVSAGEWGPSLCRAVRFHLGSSGIVSIKIVLNNTVRDVTDDKVGDHGRL